MMDYGLFAGMVHIALPFFLFALYASERIKLFMTFRSVNVLILDEIYNKTTCTPCKLNQGILKNGGHGKGLLCPWWLVGNLSTCQFH